MPAKTWHQIKLIKQITRLKAAIETDATLQPQLKKLENDLKSSLGSVGQKKKQKKAAVPPRAHKCRDTAGNWIICDLCKGRVHQRGCKTIKKELDCSKNRHTALGLESAKYAETHYERKTTITIEEGPITHQLPGDDG